MPSRDRVNAFVETVRQGRYVEAIEDFYAPEATMRDNLGPTRGGREVLVQFEKGVLARLEAMKTRHADLVALDGDQVVINWVFEMTDARGGVHSMDELALQTWVGDRIVEEQFYYDPSQLAGMGAA